MHLTTSEFGGCLTITKLKEILKDWPETTVKGEPSEVWVGGANSLSSPVIELDSLNSADVLLGCGSDLNTGYNTDDDINLYTASDEMRKEYHNKLARVYAIKGTQFSQLIKDVKTDKNVRLCLDELYAFISSGDIRLASLSIKTNIDLITKHPEFVEWLTKHGLIR
jgi:hypothetical protein